MDALRGAVLAVYLFGVMIYMAGAQWPGMKTQEAVKNLASLKPRIHEHPQFKAQLEILQNRQALKFASLDCWNVTANGYRKTSPSRHGIQGRQAFQPERRRARGAAEPGDGLLRTPAQGTLHDQLMFEKLQSAGDEVAARKRRHHLELCRRSRPRGGGEMKHYWEQLKPQERAGPPAAVCCCSCC